MNLPIPRRDLLRAAALLPLAAVAASPPSRSVRAFRLIEQGGLRRFSYPVQAVVPDAADGRNFRLIRDGRAIPAQFRVVETTPGQREVVLDFNASPQPLETQQYQVLFGLDVEPGPEPKSALKVEERDGRFTIAQSSSLNFELDKDPAGFLESVGSPRLESLREGSRGLFMVADGPKTEPLSARTRITRQGPLAIGLRSEWGSPDQRSTVDLTVPQSKSWIQAVWTILDPDKRISAIGLDLNLKLEGPSTLIDFGAGSTVYGQIKGTQRMILETGRDAGNPRGWVVRQGEGEEPPVLAASTDREPRPAEGWAHIMDARRCTALAVADFGKNGSKDRISIEADGHLRLTREFPGSDSRTKTLAFWLHFVPMPVQVGAATSPQAILEPLKVEWDR